jgi:UbiD family decarboxylase
MAQRRPKPKKKNYFRDLREFIELLERTGYLHRIGARIEKNSELMPLVKWQYQGLADGQRKAFLFENVTDPQGKTYDCHVVVGTLGASRVKTADVREPMIQFPCLARLTPQNGWSSRLRTRESVYPKTWSFIY